MIHPPRGETQARRKPGFFHPRSYNPPVPTQTPPAAPLPYRVAVLCYLFDADGRVLLLHRRKPPNRDLYSPIGGKIETAVGESPTACAAREIFEEAGVKVGIEDLRLAGIVSENHFKNETHWLMFLYEVKHPVVVPHGQDAPGEGRLEWFTRAQLETLPLPETDREIIWPAFWSHREKFFMLHIDCSGEKLAWRMEQ